VSLRKVFRHNQTVHRACRQILQTVAKAKARNQKVLNRTVRKAIAQVAKAKARSLKVTQASQKAVKVFQVTVVCHLTARKAFLVKAKARNQKVTLRNLTQVNRKVPKVILVKACRLILH
jgi:hypothetical protein